MTAPRILMRREGPGRPVQPPSPETGWALLGGVGLAFALVGLADLVLAWYPPSFGNRAWAFGTATVVLNGMPLFAMGLGLVFAAAVARGSRRTTRVVSGVVATLALVVAAILVLYLSTVPTAQESVTDPVLQGGLHNAIAKAVIQGVAYVGAFSWIAWQGFSHARRTG